MFWDNIQTPLSTISYSGLKSYHLKQHSFSSTFSFPLDSSAKGNLYISSGFWTKSKNYTYNSSILSVISVEGKNGNILWKSKPLDEQLLDNDNWHNMFHFIKYVYTGEPVVLKVFVWNQGESDLLIDDFKIEIRKN